MKILITGSSGQIGTNLALRLLRGGHEVFGVDKRQNTWTDEFPYLLQDLAGHYAPFPGGINGVEYPETDLVVHLAAHAKVHQLVGRASSRARERGDDLQRPRVRASGEHPDRLLVEPRGVRRRAPVRGLQRAGRRLRLHGEHVLRVEDRGRGVHLLVRALLRAPLPRLPILERLRALRQRPPSHGPGHPALHPLDDARRAHHDLRGTGQDARLHLRRRLRRRDRARHRGPRRAPGRQPDDQPRLRGGEHARALRRADRPRARHRAGDDARAVPARRGHALRRRPLEGARAPRLRPEGAARRRHRTCGRLVPGAPRGPSGGEHVRPARTTSAPSELGQGWKTAPVG